MKQVIIDFSSSGLVKACEKFIKSLFKSMVIAGILFLIDAITHYTVPVGAYTILIGSALALARAILDFFLIWLGTASNPTPAVAG